MPRVAAVTPYFDFFPELKAELSAKYPGTEIPHRPQAAVRKMTLIEFVKGHDTALIGLDRFNDRVCAALPELKTLCLCSAGVDHLDPAVLNKYGIKMYWAAGINKVSVSELAVAFMVFTVRKVHFFSPDPAPRRMEGPDRPRGGSARTRLSAFTAAAISARKSSSCCSLTASRSSRSDRADISEFCKQYGVENVSAEELWARSDVLTIHLSRNKTTIGMYDAATLDKLKPGMVLINCARGSMVDEVALKERLESGRISGAAFDVYHVEPANGNPLLDVPNFYGSPHIGATTRDSWSAMLRSGMYGIEHAYRAGAGRLSMH